MESVSFKFGLIWYMCLILFVSIGFPIIAYLYGIEIIGYLMLPCFGAFLVPWFVSAWYDWK